MLEKNNNQLEEVAGIYKIIDYLYDGEQEAFNALFFIKSNYKEWSAMVVWLKRNNIKGKKLVEFFQNESVDGGGYHLGATKILSMIKGLRHQTEGIKIDQLI